MSTAGISWRRSRPTGVGTPGGDGPEPVERRAGPGHPADVAAPPVAAAPWPAPLAWPDLRRADRRDADPAAAGAVRPSAREVDRRRTPAGAGIRPPKGSSISGRAGRAGRPGRLAPSSALVAQPA